MDVHLSQFMMGCNSEPLWNFEEWAEGLGCGKEEIDGPLYVPLRAHGRAHTHTYGYRDRETERQRDRERQMHTHSHTHTRARARAQIRV